MWNLRSPARDWAWAFRVGVLCYPLLPLPSICHHQGLFQRISTSHQEAKGLAVQFQHESFQWIFRVDLGLTSKISLVSKSLLQHHSLKALILQWSTFFMDYWKNKSLTIWIFVGKVISLLFNNQSRFVIFSPSIHHEVMGLDVMIFIFWMLSFKPACSLPYFTFIKKLFSFS